MMLMMILIVIESHSELTKKELKESHFLFIEFIYKCTSSAFDWMKFLYFFLQIKKPETPMRFSFQQTFFVCSFFFRFLLFKLKNNFISTHWIEQNFFFSSLSFSRPFRPRLKMMLFWLKSKRASTHGTTNDQTTAIELVVVSFLSLYFAECNFFARFFFFFFFSFFKKNPQRMLIGIRNVALLISSTLCVLCLCHSIPFNISRLKSLNSLGLFLHFHQVIIIQKTRW